MTLDEESLKALDERLKKARGEPESIMEDGVPSPVGAAWKLGIELVIGVVVGVILGSAIDDWMGTKPWGMLAMILLGFAAGIRNVIREATRMQKQMERDNSTK